MKFKAALILSVFGLPFFGAYAEDVTVNINGSILAQSCNIRSNDLSQNVNFNNINPQDLSSTGATTAKERVNIRLDNCTGDVSAMSYQFSGTGDESNANLLKVTGKSTSAPEDIATGLAIEILDLNEKQIPLNQVVNLGSTITASSYNFGFYLRYRATAAKVGPGDASSILYVDFYYE